LIEKVNTVAPAAGVQRKAVACLAGVSQPMQIKHRGSGNKDQVVAAGWEMFLTYKGHLRCRPTRTYLITQLPGGMRLSPALNFFCFFFCFKTKKEELTIARS
jgi:hypothetical protein